MAWRGIHWWERFVRDSCWQIPTRRLIQLSQSRSTGWGRWPAASQQLSSTTSCSPPSMTNSPSAWRSWSAARWATTTSTKPTWRWRQSSAAPPHGAAARVHTPVKALEFSVGSRCCCSLFVWNTNEDCGPGSVGISLSFTPFVWPSTQFVFKLMIIHTSRVGECLDGAVCWIYFPYQYSLLSQVCFFICLFLFSIFISIHFLFLTDVCTLEMSVTFLSK